ncbi:hypothetical protein CYMTET_8900 [Cymbomonas tetramitiformis]|uniref:Uncharacterized protein n=1 Tax=Cymbomonas tetramitiformis TaxID=36881 RepID=A0AAE0LG19_9CHLO|nr:hypothetical protein CYMTET_8900 [Cymbomonas tetramitiformis]
MSFAKTWIRPEVYPIFVVIGGACGLCVFQCTRCMFCSPDTRIMKETRAMGVLEDDSYFKEGGKFYNHAVRRFCAAQSTEMMPSLNKTFGGSD